MNILVTGGTGYIGSHTVVELMNAGYDVTVVDNFYNFKPDVFDEIKTIIVKRSAFFEANCCDKNVNNLKIPYVIKPRRAGDIPTCYTDASKAKEELGWEATKTIEEMCKDAYAFVKASM